MKWIKVFLILIALILLAGTAQAMSSDNYRLDWFTPLTGSGGATNSNHYAINFTIGQTVIGVSSNTSYEGCLGYWSGMVSGRTLYLPTNFKNYSWHP